APVYNIMAPCAKHVFLLTDETKIEETMRSAFDIARSGRPGPVVVDIPRDVQLTQMPFRGSGLLRLRGYDERRAEQARAHLDQASAKAFFEMLSRAERPLLYAGGGVVNADAAGELRRFAERFGIPV